jgi:8-oxo-dGTP pyrophosphatase MutT (NUDIX family)
MHKDFQARLAAVLAGRPPERVSLSEARDAAVLIPIVSSGDDPRLIFTVRTDTLPSHKGQISFPGGGIDPGEDAVTTALREAREELSIPPASVRVLGELDSVPTFVSGYVVHPVIGWLDEPPQLEPNPAEVARVLEIPISELTEEIRHEPGFTHSGRTYPTEAWIWNQEIIWGVTARVLRLFFYRLAEAGLAEAPVESAFPWPSARP